MYKKMMITGFLVATCAAVLTSCRQPHMMKQLEQSLLQANIEGTKLFGYNPDLELFATASPDQDVVTISAHGYGANKRTGKYVAQYSPLSGYVLTLNLPDHDYSPGDQHNLRHGSIDEILPLAYALKVAYDAGVRRVNLYGFSAGGGAVVNLIGMLNSDRFNYELARIGISGEDKHELLSAVQQGLVILDVPLKSVEEIIKGRGPSQELLNFAEKYKVNNLRPIDSLHHLSGLGLHVLVYFETPDEVLFNTDDAEFIKRLREANSSGTTEVFFGSHGGHSTWHDELWSGCKAALGK